MINVSSDTVPVSIWDTAANGDKPCTSGFLVVGDDSQESPLIHVDDLCGTDKFYEVPVGCWPISVGFNKLTKITAKMQTPGMAASVSFFPASLLEGTPGAR